MKVSVFFAFFLLLVLVCASFTHAGGKKGKGKGGDDGGKGKGKGKDHLIHDTLEVDTLLEAQSWHEGMNLLGEKKGGDGKKG